MTARKKLQLDWSHWKFGFDDLMEPIARRVAEVILDELNKENGAFDSIWIEKDIGPALAVTDGWQDHVIFPLAEARLAPVDDDYYFDTDELPAAIRGTQLGIGLFERWAAELRKYLDALENRLARESAE